jgi:hypothetical protein
VPETLQKSLCRKRLRTLIGLLVVGRDGSSNLPPLCGAYVFRLVAKGCTKGSTAGVRNGAEVGVLVARRSGREDREFGGLSRLPARADGDAVPIPRGPRGSWRAAPPAPETARSWGARRPSVLTACDASTREALHR